MTWWMSWFRNNVPSTPGLSSGAVRGAEGTLQRSIRRPSADQYRLALAGPKAAAPLPDSKALRGFAYAFLLGALLLAPPPLASAQQRSFADRRDDAMNLFNAAKMEEACDAFKALNKENPDDKQAQLYLKISCDTVKKLQKNEEDLFNQGVQLFNQGQLDDAKQKFEQSGRIAGLKTFHYKAQALQYIKDIATRQQAQAQAQAQAKEDANFNDAVKLYNAGKFSAAQPLFNQVAQGNGPKAGSARDYLAKIRAEEEMAKTFQEGKRLYKAGKNAEARDDFDKVAKAGGANAAEAQDYLRKIEEQQKGKEHPKPAGGGETARNNPPPPPTNPTGGAAVQPPASDDTLRAGLKAYFAGDLATAERDLSDYINNHGQKQELAHFFRGATRSTLYFLSGEKDSSEKSQAVADFQAAKSGGQEIQSSAQKYISPKILALYSQAAAQ